jgi:hypothetical protein
VCVFLKPGHEASLNSTKKFSYHDGHFQKIIHKLKRCFFHQGTFFHCKFLPRSFFVSWVKPDGVHACHQWWLGIRWDSHSKEWSGWYILYKIDNDLRSTAGHLCCGGTVFKAGKFLFWRDARVWTLSSLYQDSIVRCITYTFMLTLLALYLIFVFLIPNLRYIKYCHLCLDIGVICSIAIAETGTRWCQQTAQ